MPMTNQTITVSTVETMTEVVAGLAREGLAFTCEEVGQHWVIEITGY